MRALLKQIEKDCFKVEAEEGFTTDMDTCSSYVLN